MFACKHVLFFVTQIYSLLFCHADFADDADLFFFTQSFLRRCRRSFLNFRLVCPTRLGLGASSLYLSLRPVTVGSGCVGQILLLSFTFPLGVPADFKSAGTPGGVALLIIILLLHCRLYQERCNCLSASFHQVLSLPMHRRLPCPSLLGCGMLRLRLFLSHLSS